MSETTALYIEIKPKVNKREKDEFNLKIKEGYNDVLNKRTKPAEEVFAEMYKNFRL